jgi:hypothetical protein
MKTQTPLAPKPTITAFLERRTVKVSWMRHCLWCLVAVIGGLAFIEMMLAVAHIGEEQFVEFAPVFGTWHMDSKLITWRSEGYSRSMTNSLGYREREFAMAKPAGVKRIVILGDSMAEGLQVDPVDTFGRGLERKLNQRSGDEKYQVINAAMSGHSSVQELYLFKSKIAALKPDVCIVGYDVGDNEENSPPVVGGSDQPRPYCFIGPDGQLHTDWSFYDANSSSASARFFRGTEGLRRHSRLWDVLSKLDLQLSGYPAYARARSLLFKPSKAVTAERRTTLTSEDILGTTVAPPPLTFDANSRTNVSPAPNAADKESALQAAASAVWRQSLVSSQEQFNVTARIIQEFNAVCRQNGCRLVVLAMPAPDNSMFYFRELQRMRRLAAHDKFLFVDANERFPHRAPMAPSPLFFNVHMSAAGHAIVAEQLSKAL